MTAADEHSALAAAEQQGQRVEILAARTEYSQTFATPRGTLLVEEHVRPQWVRRPDGSWAGADPSLVQAPDGSWAPRAATVQLRFSDGGDGPFASISTGASSVSLQWPDSLPEPVVEGNVATYPAVAPGVDLQVAADVEGFTQLVVARSPKAWESMSEITLATQLSGVSLRVTDAGSVEAVDGDGEVLFAGPSPMMWDSRDSASDAGQPAPPQDGPVDKPDDPLPPDAGGPTEPATAPVSVAVTPGRLTLTPDPGMIADAETVYPVFVNPPLVLVTGKRNNWSLLRKSYPSSSFYNPPMGSINSSDSTRGIVRAGFVVEDRTYTDRSVFNMSTSAVRYRQVYDAKLSMTQAWSYYNCGSSTRPVTELRSVTSFGSSTTWNSQPTWGSLLATSNKVRKYGYSCGPQRVEYNVKNYVRSAADAGWSSVNLGLRARSETTGNWSRFKLDVKLSIEYNTVPNAPNTLRVQGKRCGTELQQTYVTVDRPDFSAKVSDRDSGQQEMLTHFYWWRKGQNRNINIHVEGTSANPATVTSERIPVGRELVDRVVYRFQARTGDGYDHGWSNYECEFQAWLTPPNAPADVTSAAYPEYNPTNPGTGSGGVGIPGQFTIVPPTSRLADITDYAYTLDTGVSAAQAQTVRRTDGPVSFTLVPRRAGENILRVWSKDVAGLFSQPVEYRFMVREGSGPAAQWLFDTPTAVGEDDTGHSNNVTLNGNAAVVPGRAGVGQALALDGAGDYAATTGPLTQPHPDTGAPLTVRTDSTFTVSAWVRLTATGSAVHTAVAAQGVRSSAFQLGYYGPSNRWRFAMAAADTDDPQTPVVLSDAAPTAGRWTHLAGTFDAGSRQLRLYVNGVAQAASTTLTGGFHATGPVAVGRRMWNGAVGTYFNGQVDDVRVYSFLVPVPELRAAARPLPPVISFPDGNTAQVGGTLRVRFDASGDTNITSFRYSVGDDELDLTATPSTAGGAVTVTIPVSAVGDLPIVATTVDRLGQRSLTAEATATITGGPEVSGVVYDSATLLPTAGVTVSLDELNMFATTGVDGKFRFTNLIAGTYILAAQAGGQCGLAAATEVEISAPIVVDLTLKPARDSFGYECQEVPETPFIPSTGSALALAGDDAVTQVTLPFSFPFYGQPQTTAWIDTNGLVGFENPNGSNPAGDGGIPSPADPDAIVAAYWADLIVDAQASVRTQAIGAAPQRLFVIEWRNVRLKVDPSARLSVQVTLTEDGYVLLQYSGMDNGLERGQEAVVGIESPGGQMGIQYSYKQAVLANDRQIVIVYPQQPAPVVTADLSGSVIDTATGEPAAGVEVLLEPGGQTATSGGNGSFTFTDLEAGTYTVEAVTRSHCGKAAQVDVELEASSAIQLALRPTADEYGYTCMAGPRGLLPTSTTLDLSGDDLNQQVALPFAFSVYGESQSQVWVNTNGILIFAPESYSWHNPVEIPSVQLSPGAAVYGFWSDLIVDAAASVRTGVVGAAPNRQFVVEWRNAHHVTDTTARVTFQVVLHETSHQIAVAWSDIGTNPLERGLHAVVGIENADGTIALPYQEFDQAIASGQGVLFTPGGPGARAVSGVVTCAGSPVAGAEVRVGEQAATTNAQGGFSFAGMQPGPQGLVASAAAGACAGAVSMPVSAADGVSEPVEVELTPVTQAPGYTATRIATTALAANTVVALPGTDGGDDEYTQLTPPFPIRLFGQAYSQAWVDTNGYLAFADPGASNALPFTVPTQDWAPRPAVFPFWNDWVVDAQASVLTGLHGTAPNRRWVVEWRDVHPYNLWHRVSFQVVFDETTGRITFSYRDIDPTFVERGGAGLTGLQNAAGTVAVEFSHLAPVLRNDRGLVLAPVS